MVSRERAVRRVVGLCFACVLAACTQASDDGEAGAGASSLPTAGTAPTAGLAAGNAGVNAGSAGSASRDEIIAIVNSHLDGLEDADGSAIPFAEAASRNENGIGTASGIQAIMVNRDYRTSSGWE